MSKNTPDKNAGPSIGNVENLARYEDLKRLAKEKGLEFADARAAEQRRSYQKLSRDASKISEEAGKYLKERLDGRATPLCGFQLVQTTKKVLDEEAMKRDGIWEDFEKAREYIDRMTKAYQKEEPGSPQLREVPKKAAEKPLVS